VPTTGAIGEDTGAPLTTAGATGTAPPPVEITGVPEPAELAADACSTAADSPPLAIVGADTGDTTGAWAGEAEPVAFKMPSPNL
jgi:hypothetical protein